MSNDLEARVTEMIKEKRKENRVKQIVYLSDIHVPFHDKKASKSIRLFLQEQQPDYLVYGGDVVDFYSVSRFDKDPARKFNIQDELTQGIIYMRTMNEAAGDAKKYFLEGNHENRIRKYLMRHPELAGLESLTVQNLLHLRQLGISYVPYDKGKMLHGFLFKHGTKASTYTARHELDMENVSGMSGHIHRIQKHSKTDRTGQHVWYTVGHLADAEQIDYFDQQVPNWQQGFGVVEINTRNKTYEAHQVVINNGKFQFQGKVYR
jgi:predicted MPP superfamily phosphohydrolase